MEDTRSSKTAEEKAQQQLHLVESFGSEKQKRLLANARRSKVDAKDLDSSLTNALPVVDNQCKIIRNAECVPQIAFTLFLLNHFPCGVLACWTPVRNTYCLSKFSVSNLHV